MTANRWPDARMTTALQNIREALLAPLWREARGLGFEWVESVEDEARHGLHGYVDRAVGGPGGAHFMEVDSTISEKADPTGVQASLWAARFLTYVRIPEFRLLRSGGFATYSGAALRFEGVTSFLTGGQPPGAARRHTSPVTLDALWAIHLEQLPPGATLVAPAANRVGAWDRLHQEYLSQITP